MDMKLSIIVPIYNVEPYLEACLDSLLSQTIGDFEIVHYSPLKPQLKFELGI